MRAMRGQRFGPAGWPLWAALAALLYLALAVLNTYPLIAHLASGVLRGIDTGDALQQTWVLAWVQHALQHNPAPSGTPRSSTRRAAHWPSTTTWPRWPSPPCRSPGSSTTR